ncbi:MAG TPA: hypothetical protein VFY66_03430, partial [Anaerolineales bacterium]|nr:hypothetical protein [Anaerolineales bacterium]
GRYGRGVIAWDLAEKVRLAGAVTGKLNHMATIHLSKGAPKSTRLDEASLRKRAATKGDVIIEVKPGEEVVSINVGWTVEKFVESVKEEKPKPRSSSPNGKSAPKSSANGRSAPAKTSSPKGKKSSAKAKTPVKKKSAPKKASKITKKTKSPKRKK